MDRRCWNILHNLLEQFEDVQRPLILRTILDEIHEAKCFVEADLGSANARHLDI